MLGYCTQYKGASQRLGLEFITAGGLDCVNYEDFLVVRGERRLRTKEMNGWWSDRNKWG